MISKKEIVFQILLHALVILFFSFDKNEPAIRMDLICLFINYAIATAFITYYLMPKYLYHHKQWHFFLFTSVVILVVILVEEYVMEPLVYPGTKRSESFAGFLPTLLDVLPEIIILAAGKFGWDAIQKQKQIEELQSTVKESELQFLRSQIHPHFLFNNLNNLYSYALDNSPKTPEIILELSGVLRYMLYECKGPYVALQKEMEQIDNFINLYKLQIEDRGQVNFTSRINNGAYKIAPLILIVFIENAFKHSQSGQTEDIEIDINIEQHDNNLLFTCANNYEKIEMERAQTQGIGLQNVYKRLSLLYPNTHDLKITQTPNRYTVFLSLELETDMS